MRISDWSSDVCSSDLVGYVGVYDLDVQRRDSDTAQSEYGRSYLNLVYTEAVAERHAQSPVYGVDRIKAAIMLVHGAKDERVPIKHMHELVDREAAVGKKPEQIEVEQEEAHGFRGSAKKGNTDQTEKPGIG